MAKINNIKKIYSFEYIQNIKNNFNNISFYYKNFPFKYNKNINILFEIYF